MLSLPNDGRYPALNLAPQQRRQKTLEALIAQIEAIARETPVLMIFEDAHWADPSSLEVFGRLVDRIDAPAGSAVRHLPAGIRRAVARASACDGADDQSARSPREVDGPDRPGRRRQAARGEYPAGHRRARGRHSAVRGGDDESGAGSRGRGRGGAHRCGGPLAGARRPSEPARLFDGAARPAGFG